jgi:SAM-dependent methyltransferase
VARRSYGSAFIEAIGDGPRRSAGHVVPLVLELTAARSVVDVGCGNGDWLSAFADRGVADLLGVEGPGSDPSLMSIDRSQIVIRDLTEPLTLDRRFDLAVCLEVGEHLEESSAPVLVASLVRLAPVILFSAAIPGQGGHHHVNEQWPDYWEALFAAHRYVAIDCIRWATWNEAEIDVWYRQNTFVYVDADRLPSMPSLGISADPNMPRRVIHPELVSSWPPRVIMRILRPAVRRSLATRWARVTHRSTPR